MKTPDNIREALITGTAEAPGIIAGLYGLLHPEAQISGFLLLAAGLYIPLVALLLHARQSSTRHTPS